MGYRHIQIKPYYKLGNGNNKPNVGLLFKIETPDYSPEPDHHLSYLIGISDNEGKFNFYPYVADLDFDITTDVYNIVETSINKSGDNYFDIFVDEHATSVNLNILVYPIVIRKGVYREIGYLPKATYDLKNIRFNLTLDSDIYDMSNISWASQYLTLLDSWYPRLFPIPHYRMGGDFNFVDSLSTTATFTHTTSALGIDVDDILRTSEGVGALFVDPTLPSIPTSLSSIVIQKDFSISLIRHYVVKNDLGQIISNQSRDIETNSLDSILNTISFGNNKTAVSGLGGTVPPMPKTFIPISCKMNSWGYEYSDETGPHIVEFPSEILTDYTTENWLTTLDGKIDNSLRVFKVTDGSTSYATSVVDSICIFTNLSYGYTGLENVNFYIGIFFNIVSTTDDTEDLGFIDPSLILHTSTYPLTVTFNTNYLDNMDHTYQWRTTSLTSSTSYYGDFQIKESGDIEMFVPSNDIYEIYIKENKIAPSGRIATRGFVTTSMTGEYVAISEEQIPLPLPYYYNSTDLELSVYIDTTFIFNNPAIYNPSGSITSYLIPNFDGVDADPIEVISDTNTYTIPVTSIDQNIILTLRVIGYPGATPVDNTLSEFTIRDLIAELTSGTIPNQDKILSTLRSDIEETIGELPENYLVDSTIARWYVKVGNVSSKSNIYTSSYKYSYMFNIPEICTQFSIDYDIRTPIDTYINIVVRYGTTTSELFPAYSSTNSRYVDVVEGINTAYVDVNLYTKNVNRSPYISWIKPIYIIEE